MQGLLCGLKKKKSKGGPNTHKPFKVSIPVPHSLPCQPLLLHSWTHFPKIHSSTGFSSFTVWPHASYLDLETFTNSNPIGSYFFIVQTPEVPGLTHWGGVNNQNLSMTALNWSHFQTILLIQGIIKGNFSSSQEIQVLTSVVYFVTLLFWSMLSSTLKKGNKTWVLASILNEYMKWEYQTGEERGFSELMMSLINFFMKKLTPWRIIQLSKCYANMRNGIDFLNVT